MDTEERRSDSRNKDPNGEFEPLTDLPITGYHVVIVICLAIFGFSIAVHCLWGFYHTSTPTEVVAPSHE